MLDVNPALEAKSNQDDAVVSQTKNDAPVWEAPKLEDVSEQVMAQPYIRFT
jgi:hypothetical protein